jgi:hypothetical protein
MVAGTGVMVTVVAVCGGGGMSSTDGATPVSESDVVLEDFNCTTCLWADDNCLVDESVTLVSLRTMVNPFLEKLVGGGLIPTTLYL